MSETGDAAGNTTAYGSLGFSYNNRGRMATTTGGSTDYLYNALGQMIEKSGTAGTTIFMEDEAGHLLGEYDGSGNLVEETIWLGDIPVATLKPNGSGGVNIFYVHTDHLNTPRKVAQPSSGTLAWRWDADPFGTATPDQNPAGLGTFAYNLRFPGQYYDAETGLNQNWNRDYDPLTAKYVESDPIGLDGGINTYAYVYDDPVELWDATGTFTYNKPPPATVPVPADVEQKVSCLENCLGRQLVITGGAEQSGHTRGSLHYTGQAVDFGFNSNPGISDLQNPFFCCALNCGFGWGQVEGPKQHRPPHYHLQVAAGNGVPRIPPSVCPSCQH